ncbi:sigma-54 dependent transcriptional regulator [Polynucleobacter sp. MWH-UH2A]|uniref:sigma-54-dependent transcriptional regulator n=1 Tax=Polynucleobacter sp. MWH-UH2A TaxID=1855617 RepID=UPI001BFDB2C5|nr:sigma-54 dependent transcriptional regulator [Polynucleobacter sp. MWH-UH2A]QWD64628.1 sigma-54-dependent Fis family transcriptional regulator [Polynucleobacter sp. MWH-UH2A]
MTELLNERFPVILVEDDEDLREAIAVTLRMKGIDFVTHQRAETVVPLLRPDLKTVLVTDYKLPGMTGIDLLKIAQKECPDLPVVIMTAFADAKLAVEALKAGARDFLIKPFVPQQLIEIISRYRAPNGVDDGTANNSIDASNSDGTANTNTTETKRTEVIGSEIRSADHNVIAVDPQTVAIFSRCERVAATDTSVLVTGESGAGKEVVANHIHKTSKRANGPYIAINCAAIPDTLLESILFGHEKGSFTGATKAQAGKFEQANKGTLFLDEIGEMPAALQTKLLRVLQDKKVERIGSTDSIQADVRIIAATNLNLQDQVKAGKFREDLYFRLNVFPIHVPELRKRPLDIIPLAEFFLKRYSVNIGRDSLTLSGPAKALLQQYSWPGNVRELENIIQRAVLLADGDQISAQDLELDSSQAYQPSHSQDQAAIPPEATENPNLSPKNGKNGTEIALNKSESQDIESIEREHILKILAEVNGNRTKAVEILGISARALRYKLKSYKDAGFLNE